MAEKASIDSGWSKVVATKIDNLSNDSIYIDMEEKPRKSQILRSQFFHIEEKKTISEEGANDGKLKKIENSKL